MKILTIAVPTFNRAVYLRRLLGNLEIQLAVNSLGERVKVLVLDNHSTDETQATVYYYKKRNPSWEYRRHAYNLGADLNFLSAFENSETEYLWIMGDDDLPRANLIDRVVSLLDSEHPDTVYLKPSWHNNIYGENRDSCEELLYTTPSALEMAFKINVFTTFISSWIVSIPALRRVGVSTESIRRSLNTHLIQLEWILPLIQEGTNKVCVTSDSILATGNNSGGYEALLVFGAHYPDIVNRIFSDNRDIRNALIKPMLRSYYPSLILNVRTGYLNGFNASKQAVPRITKRLWKYREYWTLCFTRLILPTNLLVHRPSLRITIKSIVRKPLTLIKRSSTEFFRSAFDRTCDMMCLKIQSRLESIKRREVISILNEIGKCGNSVILPLDAEVSGAKHIEIGNNFIANQGLRLNCYPSSTDNFDEEPKMVIGSDVFFNRDVFISCAQSVAIGDRCVLGSNVFITDNYHGSTERESLDRMREKLTSPGGVKIGEGVWIGNNVCILPNAEIGDGAIIGANSVVNSKIPMHVIAAGCPAKIKRKIHSQYDSDSDTYAQTMPQ